MGGCARGSPRHGRRGGGLRVRRPKGNRHHDPPALAAAARAPLGLPPPDLAGAAARLPLLPELLAVRGGGRAAARAAGGPLARAPTPLALPPVCRGRARPRP